MPKANYLVIYLFFIPLIFADPDKFQSEESPKNTKTGPLFNAIQPIPPVDPRNESPLEKKHREDSNKINATLSTASVLVANSPSIFKNIASIGSKKKGRYDRMSISGKDYIVFNFDHTVGNYYDFAKAKLLDDTKLVSLADSIGVVDYRDKFYSTGIGVGFMKNLSRSWDGGFGLGISFLSYDDFKVPYVLNNQNLTFLDERSGINLNFSGALQYNLSLYDKDNYRGSFYTSLSGGFSYTKINVEQSISNQFGNKAHTFDISDFNFNGSISLGVELWFNSVCFVPNVSFNDELNVSYGIDLHKTLGFYDTIYLRYSTGDNDLGDWHSFDLGAVITSL